MDKHTLVSLALAAIIGAIFKEIISWLFSLVKLLSLSTTVREKAKTILSKKNRAIIVDVLWLVFTLSILIYELRRTTPITRGDVLTIVVYVVGICFWSLSMILDVVLAKITRGQ